MMSDSEAKKLRCVDCVRPKGVQTGINIYTADHVQQLTNPFSEDPSQRWAKAYPAADTPEFQEKYRQGFQLYFTGKWTEAIPILKECQQLAEDDVSTGVLLDYMERLGGSPPVDHPVFKTWIGVPGEVGSGRMLTAK